MKIILRIIKFSLIFVEDPTFPSDYCPRRNGIFADPDSTVCDKFYTCKEGRHTTTPCSPGLHFHMETGTCVWPAAANRIGCAEKAPGLYSKTFITIIKTNR